MYLGDPNMASRLLRAWELREWTLGAVRTTNLVACASLRLNQPDRLGVLHR